MCPIPGTDRLLGQHGRYQERAVPVRVGTVTIAAQERFPR